VLVPPDDYIGFADAICDFVLDKAKREKYSVNASRRAEKFDVSETVDKTFEIYQRIIAG